MFLSHMFSGSCARSLGDSLRGYYTFRCPKNRQEKQKGSSLGGFGSNLGSAGSYERKEEKKEEEGGEETLMDEANWFFSELWSNCEVLLFLWRNWSGHN